MPKPSAPPWSTTAARSRDSRPPTFSSCARDRATRTAVRVDDRDHPVGAGPVAGSAPRGCPRGDQARSARSAARRRGNRGRARRRASPPRRRRARLPTAGFRVRTTRSKLSARSAAAGRRRARPYRRAGGRRGRRDDRRPVGPACRGRAARARGTPDSRRCRATARWPASRAPSHAPQLRVHRGGDGARELDAHLARLRVLLPLSTNSPMAAITASGKVLATASTIKRRRGGTTGRLLLHRQHVVLAPEVVQGPPAEQVRRSRGSRCLERRWSGPPRRSPRARHRWTSAAPALDAPPRLCPACPRDVRTRGRAASAMVSTFADPPRTSPRARRDRGCAAWWTRRQSRGLWPTLKRIVERHTYTPTDVVGELAAPFLVTRCFR